MREHDEIKLLYEYLLGIFNLINSEVPRSQQRSIEDLLAIAQDGLENEANTTRIRKELVQSIEATFGNRHFLDGLFIWREDFRERVQLNKQLNERVKQLLTTTSLRPESRFGKSQSE